MENMSSLMHKRSIKMKNMIISILKSSLYKKIQSIDEQGPHYFHKTKQ